MWLVNAKLCFSHATGLTEMDSWCLWAKIGGPIHQKKIWKNFLSWNFVCQRGFCHSKSQYIHCGRSICVPRQLYTWLWTKKSLNWLKTHLSYFSLNPYIDMWNIIFWCVTSNGIWFSQNDSKPTVGTFFMVFTSHVMQNKILCGYWALKTVFGQSKTRFR